MKPPEINPAIFESFTIDDDSVTPIWLQVKNRIIYLINSGQLAQGDPLPSMRQLSVHLQVNMNTISKVYQSLQQDGFLVSQRGKGLFVSDLSKVSPDAVDVAGRALAEEFIWRCRSGGLNSQEILQLVQKTLDDMDRTA